MERRLEGARDPVAARRRLVAVVEVLTLDAAERILIEKALERNQGNVSKAAEDLGLSRSALYRRLQRYGM